MPLINPSREGPGTALPSRGAPRSRGVALEGDSAPPHDRVQPNRLLPPDPNLSCVQVLPGELPRHTAGKSKGWAMSSGPGTRIRNQSLPGPTGLPCARHAGKACLNSHDSSPAASQTRRWTLASAAGLSLRAPFSPTSCLKARHAHTCPGPRVASVTHVRWHAPPVA